MNRNDSVQYGFRLNLKNPDHLLVHETLMDLDLEIHKSRSMFIIDALVNTIKGIRPENLNVVEKTLDRKTGIIRPLNLTLDVYKGALIVLVVLRHVLQYSVSDEGGILTNFIWAVQMPGFMLVAGYFAARRIEKIRAVGKRAILSAQHYALPFFSWFLLVEVLLLGNNNRNPITGLGKLLTNVDGGLWFLWVVFILSVIATLTDFALSSCKNNVLNVNFALYLH